MLFYKIWGDLIEDPEEETEGEENKKHRSPFRQVAAKTEEFNQSKEAFCFLSEVDDDAITLGLITCAPMDVTSFIQKYAEFIEFKVENFKHSEIMLHELQELLGRADRRNYVDSDDKILAKFDLDKISGLRSRELAFGENLVKEQMTKQTLTAAAKDLHMNETLQVELDRIYESGAFQNAMGHPVHYMIETDNPDVRRETYKIILNALRANRRLDSNRYVFLNFEPGEEYSQTAFETLYKVCRGGAVVIRYSSDEKARGAAEEQETIENICRMAKRYRNEVLTVFCIPRECKEVKDLFFDHLHSMTLVEISEDQMNRAEAADFLAALAKEHQVTPDEKLLASLDAKETHRAAELQGVFDEWYGEQLKQVFYPQYSEMAAIRKEEVTTVKESKALQELMQMVGLTEAKETIKKALNHYKMQKLYKDRGISQKNPAMHMIFTGNPGTAKTTVARLFARIMQESGLLSKGHLVEVGRGDLVGKYVGWTAPTVKAKFKEAMGGVLFIDEAYSLADEDRTSFGMEAINTIVQEMENHRDHMVVIFAGYPDKMEHFLQKNPGLRSRIAFHVPFADYNTDELCSIAKMIGEQGGMHWDAGAFDKLQKALDAARQSGDFGNGRYVRNLFEQAKMNQATRLLEKDFDDITTEDITTITAEDIVIPEGVKKVEKRRIGFY